MWPVPGEANDLHTTTYQPNTAPCTPGCERSDATQHSHTLHNNRLRKRGPRSAAAQTKRQPRKDLYTALRVKTTTTSGTTNATALQATTTTASGVNTQTTPQPPLPPPPAAPSTSVAPPPEPTLASADGFESTELHCVHLNVRGFLRHQAELLAHLESLGFPTLVGLTETFLDKSTAEAKLPGYTRVSRRDRSDGRKCGGILLFVRSDAANNVVHLSDSATFERSWHLVFTNHGPLLLVLWYRPPCSGEVASIDALEEEYLEHKQHGVGTLLMGDMNVHHSRWLYYSASVTPEGRALHNFCCKFGFEECVKKPTRGAYLLDLVLTDMSGCVTAKVHPKLADHSLVECHLSCKVPKTLAVERQCWAFKHADWKGFNRFLHSSSWGWLDNQESVDTLAQKLNDFLLDNAKRFIPMRIKKTLRSTHPWMNDHCRALVEEKRRFEGTPEYRDKLVACNVGILLQYNLYVDRMCQKLKQVPRSSKQWWKLSRSLALRSEKTSTVPPLKRQDGTWARTSSEKAELFHTTFTSKYELPPQVENAYSTLRGAESTSQNQFCAIRTRTAVQLLKDLDETSGTGPDRLGTRILRNCAKALGPAVAKLARAILRSGQWPAPWKVHWVMPLYKRNAVHDANNYRGIHLTSQLSKVVERLLGRFFLPALDSANHFGPNQFAYRPKRGCRDALALNLLNWIWLIHKGYKVGLYCSDVAGAFDRVDSERLRAKLQHNGVRGQVFKVVSDWLEGRQMLVVVNGHTTSPTELNNQVYQGTVWGPPLWNLFFADARFPVNEAGFVDVFFADDLNCYQAYFGDASNHEVLSDLTRCQQALHLWGDANRVCFDSGKEGFHVLHRWDGTDEVFRMLGVDFDSQLLMAEECNKLASECHWKLKTLLTSRKYYRTAELVNLYKTHVLSYIEFRTSAIYHASSTVLAPVDKIQRSFLHSLGISDADALLRYNLAPLTTRRDIAMLGLVHRAALGLGPPHFREWFRPAGPPTHAHRTRSLTTQHNRQLHDYVDGSHSVLLRRSALGLPRVYNKLSQQLVDTSSVSFFQSKLQEAVKLQLREGNENWQYTFSPR